MTENQPGDHRPQDETSPLTAQPAASTAVADPPTTPPPPPYAGEPQAPRTRLRDRARRIPKAAWLSAAAVVVLVGVALGGFFIGRATADGGGGFPDRGQRPDFAGNGGPGGQMPGMPGQQGGPGQGAPGQQGQPGSDTEDGTDSGATEGSADTTAWYVVPAAA